MSGYNTTHCNTLQQQHTRTHYKTCRRNEGRNFNYVAGCNAPEHIAKHGNTFRRSKGQVSPDKLNVM